MTARMLEPNEVPDVIAKSYQNIVFVRLSEWDENDEQGKNSVIMVKLAGGEVRRWQLFDNVWTPT